MMTMTMTTTSTFSIGPGYEVSGVSDGQHAVETLFAFISQSSMTGSDGYDTVCSVTLGTVDIAVSTRSILVSGDPPRFA